MSILVLTLKQRVGPVLPSLLGELKLTTGELPQSLSLTIKRNWLSPRLPEIRFWMPSAPSHSLHLLSCGDSQLHVFFLAKALQQPPHILCVAMEGLPTGQRWERKGSSTLGLQHDPVLPKDDSPKLKQGMASSGRAERESYALWQLVSYKSSSKLTLHGDKWAWASVELRHKSESKHKRRHLIEGTVTSAPSTVRCLTPPGVPLPWALRIPDAGSSLFCQPVYSVLGWVYSLATILWLFIVLHYVDLKITFLWLLPSWWPGVRWAKHAIWNPRP